MAIKQIRVSEEEMAALIRTPHLLVELSFGVRGAWAEWDDEKPEEISPTLRRLMEIKRENEREQQWAEGLARNHGV